LAFQKIALFRHLLALDFNLAVLLEEQDGLKASNQHEQPVECVLQITALQWGTRKLLELPIRAILFLCSWACACRGLIWFYLLSWGNNLTWRERFACAALSAVFVSAAWGLCWLSVSSFFWHS